jgi:glucose/arabinose dehydrogenase
MFRILLPSFFWMLLATAAAAQSVFPMPSGRDIHHNIIVDGLMHPSRMVVDDHGALWIVCSRDGRLFHRSSGGTLTHVGSVALDPELTSGEYGQVSGLAVRSESDGISTVFLAYTRNTSELVIARASVEGNNLGELTTLMVIPNVPYNRRSAILAVNDGTLLVSVPSFDTPAPLSPATLTGKVIRIHDDGSPAADNPFANPTTSATPMAFVYSFGHRNVSGLTSVDGSLTSTYAVEAGAVGADEVNRLLPGRNYGWFRHQGYCSTSTEANTCPEMTFAHVPFDVAWYGSNAIPSFKQSLLIATVTSPSLLVARTSASGTVIDHNPMADPFNTFVEEPWRVLTFERDGEIERVTCVTTMPDGSIAVGTETADGRGRIHRLYDPVSTGVESASVAADYSASPLPAHTSLTFTRGTPDDSQQNILLTDLTGRRMASAAFPSGDQHATVSVQGIPSGTYIARIGTWTSLIVVRH